MHDEWEGPKIRARAAVRHTATGLTVEQVQKATDEACMRERIRSKVCESDEDARAIGIAVAEHTEWRRIGYVMEEEGLGTYEPERDPTAVRWAREGQAARLERARGEEAVRERRAQARQDRAGELVLDFPLDAETSRQLRTYAATQGVTPQRLVGLLAERARTTSEGLIEVTPFAASDTER
ncbi:hypothetical protein [Streptomyces sp. SS8]